MLPLLIAALLAQTPSYRGSSRVPRDGRCSSRDNSCGSVANPSFAFLPASGAGAGTECAGTVPGGSKGEPITFTRAGGQTCTKANGTVVKLTANQPVIETLTGRALSDGNTNIVGTQLGMLDEAASTNVILQSEAFDNVAWQHLNSVVALPTVTANAAVAPDGTTTADRVQFPATTAGQYSFVFQNPSLAAGPYSEALYVEGNASSGNLTLRATDGSTGVCFQCAYVPSVWSRCVPPPQSNATTSVFIEIGGLAGNGCSTSAAADVFLWGGQVEAGAFATSYIPTTTVAVTRSVTSFTVDTSTLTPAVTSAVGCFGADAYFPVGEADPNMAYGCGLSGGSSGSRLPYEARIGAGNIQMRIFDGANQNSTTGLSITYGGTLQSTWGFWASTTGPINSNSTLWGLGTPQATYNNNVLGGGAGLSGVLTLGHTSSGCGANPVAWLTRIRMDTDGTGVKCR